MNPVPLESRKYMMQANLTEFLPHLVEIKTTFDVVIINTIINNLIYNDKNNINLIIIILIQSKNIINTIMLNNTGAM